MSTSFSRVHTAIVLIAGLAAIPVPTQIAVQRGHTLASSNSPFLASPYHGSKAEASHLPHSLFDHKSPSYDDDIDPGFIVTFRGERLSDPVDDPCTAGDNCYAGHSGLDLDLAYEPTLAASDGTIVRYGWDVAGCRGCWLGLRIDIRHDEGYFTIYGHLSVIVISAGYQVASGEVIATSGNSGNSTGPHLHFEVQTLNRLVIDPFGWQPNLARSGKEYCANANNCPDPWDTGSWCMWATGEFASYCGSVSSSVQPPDHGEEIIIDDTPNNTGGFSKSCHAGQIGQPCPYWYHDMAGYGGDSFFTNTGWPENYWAYWTPGLPVSSDYEVYARIPCSTHFTSWGARYNISGGNTYAVVTVDQQGLQIPANIYCDRWLSLGVFNLPQGQLSSVRITDATGDSTTRQVGVDAMKFVPVSHHCSESGALLAIHSPQASQSIGKCSLTAPWFVEYFNNTTLTPDPVTNEPAYTCRANEINYAWGSGGPGHSVTTDSFSARWSASLNLPTATYTFHARSDDGVRLYIDGARVIDAWYVQGATDHTYSISLSAGRHYIQMEYFEQSGDALAQLWWETAATGCSGDTQPPTGAFYFPSDGSTANSTISYSIGGYDYGCGVDYVLFRATYPGQAWHSVGRRDDDCPGNGSGCLYSYDWDVSSLPNGTQITLGYDVYDKAGLAAYTPGGTRRVTIQRTSANQPPAITLDAANGSPLASICSRSTTWTFTGAASDPEGSLNRVEFGCSGGGCGQFVSAGLSGGTWTHTRSGMTGRNDVWFVAYDNAGANTSSRHLDLKVDTYAALVTAKVNGQTSWPAWLTAPAVVSLHAEDQGPAGAVCGVNRLAYSLGNSINIVYASDVSFTLITEGAYQLSHMAYDNAGNEGPISEQKAIRIDLNAPETSLALNGRPQGSWPAWFNTSVQATLSANDNGSGVARIEYQLNSGAWQMCYAASCSVPAPGEGQQGLAFRAADNAQRLETLRTATFRVDTIAPSAPAAVAESHGVANNTWQNGVAAPSFTWDAGSDAGSGVAQYQARVTNQNTGSVVADVMRAANDRQLALSAQPTGAYVLALRAQDNAGNWSGWANRFTFRFDNTPPNPPASLVHTSGITNDIWQTRTASAAFTWQFADAGVGTGGYDVYWGADPNGVSANHVTSGSYTAGPPSAACATQLECTGYLRLRPHDALGNLGAWLTAFVLRYDAAPPIVASLIVITGGTGAGNVALPAGTTWISVTATDRGSGLRQMRLRVRGSEWSDWMSYASQFLWQLPSETEPVDLCAQAKDGAGWESDEACRTVLWSPPDLWQQYLPMSKRGTATPVRKQ